MNLEEDSVHITPYSPEEISVLGVSDLPARGKTYNIRIRGRGHEIRSVATNGAQSCQLIALADH